MNRRRARIEALDIAEKVIWEYLNRDRVYPYPDEPDEDEKKVRRELVDIAARLAERSHNLSSS